MKRLSAQDDNNTATTNALLVTPKIASGGSINDAVGNEIIKFYSGASSVNQIVLQNSATTLAPAIYPEGDDTNVHLDLFGRGTGSVRVNSVRILTESETQTVTNKRITRRTGTTTSSATPTINTDNVDYYSLTAQTVDITSFSTNLSGTPTEGQTLWIVIIGTAARAITWGASFEASTVALPTTTVSTNRLDVGFVWNTVTSKWRCVASA